MFMELNRAQQMSLNVNESLTRNECQREEVYLQKPWGIGCVCLHPCYLPPLFANVSCEWKTFL